MEKFYIVSKNSPPSLTSPYVIPETCLSSRLRPLRPYVALRVPRPQARAPPLATLRAEPPNTLTPPR